MDLTCGSGAMPFQAETWGRRWIAIDVAQVSIAIARERLITNTYPYHMLKDSPEGAKMDHEMEQATPTDQRNGNHSRRQLDGHLQARPPEEGSWSSASSGVSASDPWPTDMDGEKPIKHP